MAQGWISQTDRVGMARDVLQLQESRRRAQERLRGRAERELTGYTVALSNLDLRLGMDEDQENRMVGAANSIAEYLGIEWADPDAINAGMAKSIDLMRKNEHLRQLPPAQRMGLLTGRYGMKRVMDYAEAALGMAMEAAAGQEAAPPAGEEAVAPPEMGVTGSTQDLADALFGGYFDDPNAPKPISIPELAQLTEFDPERAEPGFLTAAAKALNQPEEIVRSLMLYETTAELDRARRDPFGQLLSDVEAATLGLPAQARGMSKGETFLQEALTQAPLRGVTLTPDQMDTLTTRADQIDTRERAEASLGLREGELAARKAAAAKDKDEAEGMPTGIKRMLDELQQYEDEFADIEAELAGGWRPVGPLAIIRKIPKVTEEGDPVRFASLTARRAELQQVVIPNYRQQLARTPWDPYAKRAKEGKGEGWGDNFRLLEEAEGPGWAEAFQQRRKENEEKGMTPEENDKDLIAWGKGLGLAFFEGW